MILDLSDNPHIFVYNIMEESYVHYYRDELGWNSQKLEMEGSLMSLALDRDGYFHLTYINNGLKYAYQDAS